MRNLQSFNCDSVSYLIPGRSICYGQSVRRFKKKRDIAFVITTFLDRDRKYTADEIEKIIRDNVKYDVLDRRGFAPDHIRRAMIENDYMQRDAATNVSWVSESFEGAEDVHGPRITKLKSLMDGSPEAEGDCPVCGKRLKAVALFNHYVKKHAEPEPWKKVFDEFFGW